MLTSVSYTHLRAHETSLHLVCRLLLEKKNNETSLHLVCRLLPFPYGVVGCFFFLMIRRPPRSTQGVSSAASDVYKRQAWELCWGCPVCFLLYRWLWFYKFYCRRSLSKKSWIAGPSQAARPDQSLRRFQRSNQTTAPRARAVPTLKPINTTPRSIGIGATPAD